MIQNRHTLNPKQSYLEGVDAVRPLAARTTYTLLFHGKRGLYREHSALNPYNHCRLCRVSSPVNPYMEAAGTCKIGISTAVPGFPSRLMNPIRWLWSKPGPLRVCDAGRRSYAFQEVRSRKMRTQTTRRLSKLRLSSHRTWTNKAGFLPVLSEVFSLTQSKTSTQASTWATYQNRIASNCGMR
jgi:hypothetical protein